MEGFVSAIMIVKVLGSGATGWGEGSVSFLM